MDPIQGNPGSKRRRGIDPGFATVVAALILAAGGLIGVVIGRATSHGSATPQPTVIITVTAPVHGRVGSSAPGGNGSAGGSATGEFPGAGKGGQVRTMKVPISSSGVGTGINFDTGEIIAGDGQMQYTTTETGTPELTGYSTSPYSIDVTSRNAGPQQCFTATNSDPDFKPITNFHKGLLFCVQFDGANGRQVALLEQTEPLESSKALDLRETIWPTPNS